ncbi:PorP/SprF family type IX secretion system membrane protein [Fulvivirga lutea]|uniref:Type IX secretion system membrane protein PorP/SprF n=1 Tax=Fulvivirga lutea TaxID=2810512 RepID=A0A974WEC1_9BACT|nr:type IX secretion system membrane protein PorP/SprF [Fulvivirga lutea]QSE96779.1 type IX secretion system membrane protein PorP/SprF [Fulvivirga lutea]
MNKFFKVVVFVFLTCTGAQSQQLRPVQSLYMFDLLLINPAYAGSQVQLSATSIYRNQWVNLEGAPQTFTASMQSSLLNNRMGLGLVLGKDVLGVHENYNIFASYAYKIPMYGGASLSMGLQAGFDLIQSDFTRTTVPTASGASGAPGSSDPYYLATSAANPNFGMGLFYTNRVFYAGISVPYILENDIIQDVESGQLTTESVKNTRNYYVHGGTTFQTDPNFKILASTLVRFQDGAPLSFDVNALGVIKETVGLGMGYRLVEGLIFMFELKVNENFHVGYAYDKTVSTIGRVSSGSHEIMLNYRIKIQRWHQGLECPSYF